MRLSATNDCSRQNNLEQRGIPLRIWKSLRFWSFIDYPIKNWADRLSMLKNNALEMDYFHMMIIIKNLKAQDIFSEEKNDYWHNDNKQCSNVIYNDNLYYK